VGFDDRSADRQAHPHAVRLCREKRVEYPIDVLRTNSCPSVRNRYHYLTIVMDPGFQGQHPRSADGCHRIDGVRDQVYEQLL
jgi:hypothetical protein